MPETQNLRATAGRIETLVQEFGTLPNARARHKAEEIVRLLMQLYGAGLGKFLEIAVETADKTPGGREKLFARFAEDPLVTSLLVLHDLHPQDTESRVMAALERVRPYLGSHGGNVKLLGIDGAVARVRLEGSCDGCPSSSLTIKLAVEKAIQEAAPEVERLQVDGLSDAAKTSLKTEPAKLSTAAEWITLDRLPELNDNDLAAAEFAGRKILLCRIGPNLYAYENLCPSCGAALTDAALHEEILACAGCRHNYNVRFAGRCIDDGAYHLAPLPLLADERAVRISIPVADASPPP
jgi:Fe-S cluster biogenesis protein NfuA/nitrite reductase/ring-hydroxylating ferredoxin subunit